MKNLLIKILIFCSLSIYSQSRIYEAGNFVITEDQGQVTTFLKNTSSYSESSDSFRLENKDAGHYKTIAFSRVSQWVDQSNEAYSVESLRTFLQSKLGSISIYKKRVIITQENFLDSLTSIDSSKEYFLDGIIDVGSNSITIPPEGITLTGYSFDISGLVSSEDNFSLFVSESPAIGSGNILATNLLIRTSGNNSRVHDLYDHDQNSAIEYNKVNFIACTSLGTLNNYRQYLENGTGRFGGTPELTFEGSVNGCFISTSIVRGIGDLEALFKKGNSLTFSGRFILDMNIDFNSLGAIVDFDQSNFINNESLILRDCYITRGGLIDNSDLSFVPNINQSNVKSLWSNNTGIANTVKFIDVNSQTDTQTTISAINTYYPLEGDFVVEMASHFDSPTTGQFRLLSGAGEYLVSADLDIDGTRDDEVDIRITKSSDNGSTFVQVDHQREVINNLAGGRDVAFFNLFFKVSLEEGDIIRLEVENKSSTDNLTLENDAKIIVIRI